MNNAKSPLHRVKLFTGLALLVFSFILQAPAHLSIGQTSTERPKYFCSSGKIVSVDDGMTGVTIQHVVIEGFMGAMTMHFRAEVAEVLKGIKSGDTVRFTLKMRRIRASALFFIVGTYLISIFPVLAHDYWLEPNSFFVPEGKGVRVHLYLGEAFGAEVARRCKGSEPAVSYVLGGWSSGLTRLPRT